MAIVYMIEDTKTNTFWTNNGFKKDHGNLYRSTKTAQAQIDDGKLALFIWHTSGIKTKDVKISKFVLTRVDE